MRLRVEISKGLVGLLVFFTLTLANITSIQPFITLISLRGPSATAVSLLNSFFTSLSTSASTDTFINASTSANIH